MHPPDPRRAMMVAFANLYMQWRIDERGRCVRTRFNRGSMEGGRERGRDLERYGWNKKLRDGNHHHHHRTEKANVRAYIEQRGCRTTIGI